jgi:hypothetical protein
VLNDFHKRGAETRQKKRAPGTLLHLDNAPTHRADGEFDYLEIIRLFHPPHSQDLAQCDFWLFENLKTKLEANTFTIAMEPMAKANKIFMDIP